MLSFVVMGAPGGSHARGPAGDPRWLSARAVLGADDQHSSLACRQTQMGTVGVLNLVMSSTSPAPSFVARRTAGAPVRSSALAPTLSPSSCPDGHAPPIDGSLSLSGDEGGAGGSPPPISDDGYRSDSTEGRPQPRAKTTTRRFGRQARRLVGHSPAESVAARQGALSAQISAALRRLLGARTRADEIVGSGMQVKVVGTHAASSRFLICVVGPHSVDLATLWLSPSGLPLCSCWGHTQSVALLLLTGEASSCWHANAFKSAMDSMLSERAALQKHL